MTPSRHSATKSRVLVIDDDAELLELLELRIESHGYDVQTETAASRGLALIGRLRVDVVILDLQLSDADGLDVLTEIRARNPDMPVIILTAHGSIDAAVEATRRGAYDFMTKPFLDHELIQKLAHAVERHNLRREVASLRRATEGAGEARGLVGVSRAIATIRETIARVAPSEASVLVLGESGTGKELAARSIHSLSNRASGPFLAVNCAALAPDLLESTLFGHVRGAFTGAATGREGLFAAARKGTLFLDEIGEASAAIQAKLLRVLQERRFTRVGSNTEEDADVRVIAATNRDLRAEVAAQRFREDLFYRLHVVPIAMPPLRDRREDIPLLAEVFLEQAAVRNDLAVPSLDDEALSVLLEHTWPGNVRELANVMEAALLLTPGDTLPATRLRELVQGSVVDSAPLDVATGQTARDLESSLRAVLSATGNVWPPLRETRDQFERIYLECTLERARGHVAQAAKLAGRNRSDFYELLRRHGISLSEFKSTEP